MKPLAMNVLGHGIWQELSFKDRQIYRQVCRDWQQSIDSFDNNENVLDISLKEFKIYNENRSTRCTTIKFADAQRPFPLVAAILRKLSGRFRRIGEIELEWTGGILSTQIVAILYMINRLPINPSSVRWIKLHVMGSLDESVPSVIAHLWPQAEYVHICTASTSFKAFLPLFSHCRKLQDIEIESMQMSSGLNATQEKFEINCEELECIKIEYEEFTNDGERLQLMIPTNLVEFTTTTAGQRLTVFDMDDFEFSVEMVSSIFENCPNLIEFAAEIVVPNAEDARSLIKAVKNCKSKSLQSFYFVYRDSEFLEQAQRELPHNLICAIVEKWKDTLKSLYAVLLSQTCAIDDTTLEVIIQCPFLEDLRLSNSSRMMDMSDDGMLQLKNAANLRSLVVWNSRVSSNVFEELITSCPDLHYLSIRDCPAVRNSLIEALLQKAETHPEHEFELDIGGEIGVESEQAALLITQRNLNNFSFSDQNADRDAESDASSVQGPGENAGAQAAQPNVDNNNNPNQIQQANQNQEGGAQAGQPPAAAAPADADSDDDDDDEVDDDDVDIEIIVGEDDEDDNPLLEEIQNFVDRNEGNPEAMRQQLDELVDGLLEANEFNQINMHNRRRLGDRHQPHRENRWEDAPLAVFNQLINQLSDDEDDAEGQQAEQNESEDGSIWVDTDDDDDEMDVDHDYIEDDAFD